MKWIPVVAGIVVAATVAALLASGSLQGGASQSPSVAQAAVEATYPDPTNYAVDATGTFTPAQLDALNATLKTMDTDKHQFAVAIVKTTAPLTIEEYGIKLAEKWKVGGKDTDNGAIVIIATEDRKVRIEVGYGLEGDINDAKAGRIISDDMTPLLKQGDWAGAANAALTALNNDVK